MIVRLPIASLSDECQAEIIALRLEGKWLETLIGRVVTSQSGRQYSVLHANARSPYVLLTIPGEGGTGR